MNGRLERKKRLHAIRLVYILRVSMNLQNNKVSKDSIGRRLDHTRTPLFRQSVARWYCWSWEVRGQYLVGKAFTDGFWS